MRILVLTNLHRNFHAGYYYLLKELAKREEVVCYGNFDTRRRLLPFDLDVDLFRRVNFKLGKGWHKLSKRFSQGARVRDVSRLSRDFDVCLVMLNSFFAQVGYGRKMDFIKCRKVCYLADLHLGNGANLRAVRKAGFDLVLFVYKWWMDRLKGELGNVGWLPHSVNTDVFRDYGLPKIWDAVSAGTRYAAAYPLRERIFEALNGSGLRYFYPEHPQLTLNRPCYGNNFGGQLIRENYARFLSQSMLFVFDSSIHNYALAKYVEGMASGCVVVAPIPKDSGCLGFEAGTHFVPLNMCDVKGQVEGLLGDCEFLNRVSLEARRLVEQRHSTRVRVEQLRGFLRD